MLLGPSATEWLLPEGSCDHWTIARGVSPFKQRSERPMHSGWAGGRVVMAGQILLSFHVFPNSDIFWSSLHLITMIKWLKWWTSNFFDDDQWRPKLCFSAHAPPFDYGWKHRFQGCESRSHRREIQSRSQQRSWLTWVGMTSHSQAMVNTVNWDLNVKCLWEWVYTLLQEIVLSQYEVELERISELVSVSYNIL